VWLGGGGGGGVVGGVGWVLWGFWGGMLRGGGGRRGGGEGYVVWWGGGSFCLGVTFKRKDTERRGVTGPWIHLRVAHRRHPWKVEREVKDRVDF